MAFMWIFVTSCIISSIAGAPLQENSPQGTANKPQSQKKQPDTVSLVIDQGQVGHLDYVKILNVPEVLRHESQLLIEYRCNVPQFIAIEINVKTVLTGSRIRYREVWACAMTSGGVDTRLISIRLPKYLAYAPSRLNQWSSIALGPAILRVLILPEDALPLVSAVKDTWNEFSIAKEVHRVSISPPYERPLSPSTQSRDWFGEFIIKKPWRPVCRKELDVVHAVSFPVALPGVGTGVHRTLPPFRNKVKQRDVESNATRAKFTFDIWLYIVNYCPSNLKLCSIFQRISWDDRYGTPLIYINKKGLIHLQTVSDSGHSVAYLTGFAIPTKQWCRLVVTFSVDTWTVTLLYGENQKNSHTNTFKIGSKTNVFLLDTAGLMVYGGTEINPSFQGYLGDVQYYRNKALDVAKLPRPSPFHPMFEIAIGKTSSRCSHFLSWASSRIYHCKVANEEYIRKHTCPNYFLELQQTAIEESRSSCPLNSGPKPTGYRAVGRWICHKVATRVDFNLDDLGDFLYQNSSKAIEDGGFNAIRSENVLRQLRQASCYGNHDASFMLSVILNSGIGVKADEAQAQSYLLQGALSNHRLCLMGMGNKHAYGLDGVPYDLEQAYVYYKAVADLTKYDKDGHFDSDLYTDMVRLTDTYALKQQTDEDGDLFLWFKHQAAQGVLNAQKEMARLLYWGSQGIKRNINQAVEYYRKGAESDDPAAIYDYGLVLMKGQGVEQNYTEALKYLRKSADMGNAPALNALGWHALEITKNMSEAADLFQESYRLGNADAAHNIGHMMSTGRYPGKGTDKVEAFKYFQYAARKGQIDSSLMVALYNMRGHPWMQRSPLYGVEWSRFVAEQNPQVGKLLATALKAYREKNGPLALLFYMFAAETGIEVGNFNLAYLCEENMDFVTSYVEKECVWRYYNLSTLREPQFVDPYSWIKMGDFYWYGCQGQRNKSEAVMMYANAAYRGDPHALFNLAYLVEEGASVPEVVWKRLHLQKAARGKNSTLLAAIYTKCRETPNSDAYIPCSLALARIQILEFWVQYRLVLIITTLLSTITLAACSTATSFSQTNANSINTV